METQPGSTARVRDKLPSWLDDVERQDLVHFRSEVRRFVAHEVAPYVDTWEEAGHYDPEVVRKMADLGYLGIGFDERYGGSQGGILHQIVLTEELSFSGALSLPDAVVGHAFIIAPYLATFGTHEQKLAYLEPALKGEELLTIAMTEPDHGSDLRGMSTRAERRNHDWVLTGQKMFISNGASASTHIVAARTAEDRLSLFLVRRDDPGVSVGQPLEKMGLRAVDTTPLSFDEVVLPADRLLGQEGAGMTMLRHHLGLERVLIMAMALSGALWAVETATHYASQRVQFGRPVLDFQVLRHRMAAALALMDMMRTYLFSVASDLREDRPPPTFEVASLKAILAERSFDITNEALQLMGGYGYMAEYGIERMLRDLRIFSIGGGTTEIQLEIVCRELGWAAFERPRS